MQFRSDWSLQLFFGGPLRGILKRRRGKGKRTNVDNSKKKNKKDKKILEIAAVSLVGDELAKYFEAAKQGNLKELEKHCDEKGKGVLKCKDWGGWTALHYCAQNDRSEVLEELLKLNADPLMVDNDGWTALHVAALNGSEKSVKIMVNHYEEGERGQLTNIESTDGDTAVKVAHRYGFGSIVDWLIDEGEIDEAQGCEEEDYDDDD